MDILFKTFIDHFSSNQQLADHTKAEICSHLSVLNLGKKHVLIKENQRHDFAYFVLKGAVRSYYLKDGVEVNTWFALENDMVGSLHNFKDNPSRETIELIENSTLISINLKQVKLLMFSNILIGCGCIPKLPNIEKHIRQFDLSRDAASNFQKPNLHFKDGDPVNIKLHKFVFIPNSIIQLRSHEKGDCPEFDINIGNITVVKSIF